jgi:RNA polymerase sigma-70 factor (ECF subfamily)
MNHTASDAELIEAKRVEQRLPSDRSLLRRYRLGQEDAATQLYVRYAERLRALAAAQCSSALARRVEPDDIVQSVFRTFFRRVMRGGYNVPAGGELWNLFLVIALNKIRSLATFHLAAKRDVRLVKTGDTLDRALDDVAQTDQSALDVLRLIIDEILDSLPAVQRQMIELRIQEYEVAEIAERTSRSKRTVERVLQQFRKRLQREMAIEDESPC